MKLDLTAFIWPYLKKNKPIVFTINIMKKLYILVILISTLSYSQIPENYYDSANGLTGYALKSQLKTITTNGHQARNYDQLYDGNGISGSNGYIDTHSDTAVASGTNYENDGTILEKRFWGENYLQNKDYLEILSIAGGG